MQISNKTCHWALQKSELCLKLGGRTDDLFILLLLIAACLVPDYQQSRVYAQEVAGTTAEVDQALLPLSRAHAHNDYEHPRPLMDALDHGFMSIEADVFLVNGDLLVAHYLKDVKPERNLDRLYLRPLYQRFLENQGAVYRQPGTVILLVDIKSDGEGAYTELERQLAPYKDMLTSCKDGQITEKAVTIIISGDRPIAKISESNPRFVGIDGRLSDLASAPQDQKSPTLMPLISDNWRVHFRYRGEEAMSEAERTKLREIVSQTHQQGRKIRFWATPESERVWRELTEAGVDLIGTDELDRLASFLRN